MVIKVRKGYYNLFFLFVMNFIYFICYIFVYCMLLLEFFKCVWVILKIEFEINMLNVIK